MSKRRSYFRLPDAVLRQQWDDATLAVVVRLQAFLNTRWARDMLTAEEAGDAILGPQEMMLVTGTTNVTRARKKLLELPDRMRGGIPRGDDESARGSLTVEEASHGRFRCVRVRWPNFVKEQCYHDRDRANSGPDSAPPQPYPQTATETETGNRVSAPQAAHAHTGAASTIDIDLAIEWERMLAAMHEYGGASAGARLTVSRRDALRRVIEEFGPDAHVEAVHGYALTRLDCVETDRFDPLIHFTPDVLLSGDKAVGYIESYREAQGRGDPAPSIEVNSAGMEVARGLF